MTHFSPIERFLGKVDPGEGPLGLLALTPETCDTESVRAALARQLQRVARHPEGGGPEADEVRLALHVAAAQLLDPNVREEVVQEWREYRGGVGSFALLPGGPRASTIDLSAAPSRQSIAGPSRAGPAGKAAFQRAALSALVQSGGWNKEAQGRIATLAAAYDLGAAETREALSGFATGLAARPAGTRARATAPTPESAATAPAGSAGVEVRRWASLAALVGMGLATLFLVRALAQRWPEAVAFIREAALPDVGETSEAPSLAESGGRARPDSAPSVTEPDLSSETRLGEQPRVIGRVVDRWADVARRLLGAPAGQSSEDRLERAVRLAWMNSAAAANWDGRTGDGDRFVQASQGARIRETQEDEPELGDLDPGALTAPAVSPDGLLAAKLALARRITPSPEMVAAMLTAMRTARELGPADADMVVETALASAHNDLRRTARRVVLEQADNPAVVYALLEVLTKAPRQPSVSALANRVAMRELPSVDEEEWGPAARAALVARLVELLGAAAHPRADELSRSMAAALRGRGLFAAAAPQGSEAQPSRAEDAADGSAGPGPATDEAAAAAGERTSALLSEAERQRSAQSIAARLHGIKERRRARLELAEGPIQQFHAEQLAAAEAMALIVAVERPAAGLRADLVLAELAEARRGSTDITAQIEATEWAITRLWEVRLGVPPRPAAGGGK